MLKTCKECGLEKEAVQGVWVMKHGKPVGRTCLACQSTASAIKKRKLVTLPNGEVVTSSAAYMRGLITLETGEVVTRAVANNRKVRSTPEGHAAANAAAAKHSLAKHYTDAHYRLRKYLGTATHQLVRQLAQGKAHNADWSILGTDRATALTYFEKQLAARGWTWDDYLAGGIELDHKTPLGLAQNSNELRELALLENVRLITTAENKAKRIEDVKRIRAYESGGIAS